MKPESSLVGDECRGAQCTAPLVAIEVSYPTLDLWCTPFAELGCRSNPSCGDCPLERRSSPQPMHPLQAITDAPRADDEEHQ